MTVHYDLAPLSLMAVDMVDGEPRRFRSVVERTDRSSFAAAEISQQSFLAALAAGLDVPGELAEGIALANRIGHVEYDVRAAAGIATLEINRVCVPVPAYEVLTRRAVAGDCQPWLAVENVEFDNHGRAFPLWQRAANVADGDALSSGAVHGFAGAAVAA